MGLSVVPLVAVVANLVSLVGVKRSERRTVCRIANGSGGLRREVFGSLCRIDQGAGLLREMRTHVGT